MFENRVGPRLWRSESSDSEEGTRNKFCEVKSDYRIRSGSKHVGCVCLETHHFFHVIEKASRSSFNGERIDF